MAPVDKKDVLEHMLYCILEGSYPIERAKADAEDYLGTKITLGKGDLVYIRSRVTDFVRKNEQWCDDHGKLVTSEQGQTLLLLVQ
ncbi:hypothetical protein FE782_28755 [Paenibacillus antri]|uniref:Uncharacterized protein n=1 Tax=Paenibacillus antri TaxID=2582848 RepID=A0A5R9G1F6_9BACL|nr:hypothetical protein [Paenibacillus antri]TLS48849.1 hypothetical protein FE782_28755 [Paenibacillus antri]